MSNNFPVMNMNGETPPPVAQVNCMVTSDQLQKLINTIYVLQKRVEQLEKLVINKPTYEKSIWGYSL